jgi:hypothetical protein
LRFGLGHAGLSVSRWGGRARRPMFRTESTAHRPARAGPKRARLIGRGFATAGQEALRAVVAHRGASPCLTAFLPLSPKREHATMSAARIVSRSPRRSGISASRRSSLAKASTVRSGGLAPGSAGVARRMICRKLLCLQPPLVPTPSVAPASRHGQPRCRPGSYRSGSFRARPLVCLQAQHAFGTPVRVRMCHLGIQSSTKESAGAQIVTVNHRSQVAQSVEQRTVNPWVASSSLALGVHALVLMSAHSGVFTDTSHW